MSKQHLGCFHTWCPSTVPEYDYCWDLMWTHLFFKYPCQNSGTGPVPEYKVSGTLMVSISWELRVWTQHHLVPVPRHKCSGTKCEHSLRCLGDFFLGRRACAEAKIWRKKLHKTLHSVQFLASFISFHFKILSYLSCGEKITRLASKNSLKLDEKSANNF